MSFSDLHVNRTMLLIIAFFIKALFDDLKTNLLTQRQRKILMTCSQSLFRFQSRKG